VVKNVPHHLTAVVVICSVVLTLNSVWTEPLKVLGEQVAEHAELSLEVTAVATPHMLNHNRTVFHALTAVLIALTGLVPDIVLVCLVI